jgi:hypothetical protein
LYIYLIANKKAQGAAELSSALLSCGIEFVEKLQNANALLLISDGVEVDYKTAKGIREAKEARIPVFEYVLRSGRESGLTKDVLFAVKDERNKLFELLNVEKKNREIILSEKYNLAMLLIDKGSFSQGLQILTELTAKGYKKAADTIAGIYAEGRGVKRNIGKADEIQKSFNEVAEFRDGAAPESFDAADSVAGDPFAADSVAGDPFASDSAAGDPFAAGADASVVRPVQNYIKLGTLCGKSIEWIPLSGDSSGHTHGGLMCISKHILAYTRYDLMNREFARSEVYAYLSELQNVIFSNTEKMRLYRFKPALSDISSDSGLYLSLLPSPSALEVRLRPLELQSTPFPGIAAPFGASSASNWYFLKDETKFEFKIAISSAGALVNVPSREIAGIRPVLLLKNA